MCILCEIRAGFMLTFEVYCVMDYSVFSKQLSTKYHILLCKKVSSNHISELSID